MTPPGKPEAAPPSFDAALDESGSPFGGLPGFDQSLLAELPSRPEQTFSGPSIRGRWREEETNIGESVAGDERPPDGGLTLSRWSLAGAASNPRADRGVPGRVPLSGLGDSDLAPAVPDSDRSDGERAGGADSSKAIPPAYELLRRVGRGGFGEVWMARQNSLARMVAVKTLRGDAFSSTGRDSSILRRQATLEFHQEALAAARLEHPNIVPVHDIGLSPDGAPLLAMKLVQGEPWDKALKRDLLELSPADLLGKHLPTLIAVAQAVAFAHAKGIVHRDLKPAQVMTGEFGEALLMDWGLAVYIGGGGNEAPSGDPSDSSPPSSAFLGGDSIASLPTPDTCPNPAGTPALMAPEQTEADGKRIGPWTDVYLLGATLYFILAGAYPHAAKSSAEAMAKARALDPEPPQKRAPSRDIPPDLADLCASAMRRDPSERLGSAREFADALRDYVSGASKRREAAALVREAAADAAKLDAELAGARPPQPAEVYERRGAVADSVGRALQLWPDYEEAKKLRASNLAARLETEIAQGDLILADVHVRELRKLAARGEPIDPRPGVEALENAKRRRARQRRQRKTLAVATAALLVLSVGLAWHANAQSGRARIAKLETEAIAADALEQTRRRELFQRANALRAAEDKLAEELEGKIPLPESIDAAGESSGAIAALPGEKELAALLGRRDELRRERRKLLREHLQLEEEPPALLLAEANLKLATGATRDDFEEALLLGERAAAARPDLHEALLAMGVAAYRSGHPSSATALLDRAAALAESRLGANHPDTARAHALAGEAYRLLDNSIEAVRRYEKSVAAMEPQWLDLSLALADRNNKLGRYNRALEFASPALSLARELRGPDSIEAARASYAAGRVLDSLHRADEAAAVLEGASRLFGEALGPDSRERILALKALGAAEYQRANYARANALLREALVAARRSLGEDRPEVAEILHALGAAAPDASGPEGSEQWYRQALALRQKLYGPSHPDVAVSMHDLANDLKETGRYEEAEKLTLQVLDFWRGEFGDEHPEVGWTLNTLGSLYGEMGRKEEAEAALREGLEIRQRTLGPDHPNTGRSHFMLAYLLTDVGRHEEAAAEWALALKSFEAAYGDHPETARAAVNIARNLRLMGKNEESLAAAKRSLNIALRAAASDEVALVAYVSLRNALSACVALGRANEFAALVDELAASWVADLDDPAKREHAFELLRYIPALAIQDAETAEPPPEVLAATTKWGMRVWERGDLAALDDGLARKRLLAGAALSQAMGSAAPSPDMLPFLEELVDAFHEERERLNSDELYYWDGALRMLCGYSEDFGVPTRDARYEWWLELRRSARDPADSGIAEALAKYSGAAHLRGDFGKAVALLREARAVLKSGSSDPKLRMEGEMDVAGRLARTLGTMGDADGALEEARLHAKLSADLYGAESVNALIASFNLAATASNLGAPEESEPIFRSALDRVARGELSIPNDFWYILAGNYATTLIAQGKAFEAGEAYKAQAEGAIERGMSSEEIEDALLRRGAAMRDAGLREAAAEANGRAYELARKTDPAGERAAFAAVRCVVALDELASFGEAGDVLVEFAEAAVSAGGTEPRNAAASLAFLHLSAMFETRDNPIPTMGEIDISPGYLAYEKALGILLAGDPPDPEMDWARAAREFHKLGFSYASAEEEAQARDGKTREEEIEALLAYCAAREKADDPVGTIWWTAMRVETLLYVDRTKEAETVLRAAIDRDPGVGVALLNATRGDVALPRVAEAIGYPIEDE